MNVLWVEFGLFKIHPHISRISLNARATSRAFTCADNSNDVINGEMLCPSSGDAGPIGVQFFVKPEDTEEKRSLAVALKYRAMELASCG